MKKITILAACVALVSATTAVKANLLQGDVGIGGVATFNGASASASTQVNSFSTASINLVGGDFSSIPLGTLANFLTPYVFTTGANPGFLSFDGYTFDETSSVGAPSGPFINVAAVGILSGNGISPTPYDFSFSASGSSTTTYQGYLSVDSAAVAALPDGGLTVALLGGALTTLGLIRRKLVA